MCDVSNAKDIVEELLQVNIIICFVLFMISKLCNAKGMLLKVLFFQYLATADFAMREELSLKAAILAEKFAPDLSWCGIIYEFAVLHIFQNNL